MLRFHRLTYVHAGSSQGHEASYRFNVGKPGLQFQMLPAADFDIEIASSVDGNGAPGRLSVQLLLEAEIMSLSRLLHD